MSKPIVNMVEARLAHQSDGTILMSGYVLNHPRFAQGEYILTSPIVFKNGSQVETVNTIYNVVWKKGHEQNINDQIR